MKSMRGHCVRNAGYSRMARKGHVQTSPLLFITQGPGMNFYRTAGSIGFSREDTPLTRGKALSRRKSTLSPTKDFLIHRMKKEAFRVRKGLKQFCRILLILERIRKNTMRKAAFPMNPRGYSGSGDILPGMRRHQPVIWEAFTKRNPETGMWTMKTHRHSEVPACVRHPQRSTGLMTCGKKYSRKEKKGA